MQSHVKCHFQNIHHCNYVQICPNKPQFTVYYHLCSHRMVFHTGIFVYESYGGILVALHSHHSGHIW